VDVIAYHRHLCSRGALGPLGLFGGASLSAGMGSGGSGAPAAAQGSHLDPVLRGQLKRDGWSDEKLKAVFG